MLTWNEIIELAGTNIRHSYPESTQILWLRNIMAQLDALRFNREATVKTLELKKGQQSYPLPTDCEPSDILKLEIEVNKGTGYFVEWDYRDIKDEGIEPFFTILDGELTLFPEPSEDKEAQLYYTPTPTGPTTSTLNQSPDIPSPYHEIFVHALSERIAAARGDAVRKNNFKADYDSLVGDFLMYELNGAPEYISVKDELPRRTR